MSLVSARVSLIHRTNILRSNGTVNDFGHQSQAPDDWQPHISDLACRGWVTVAKQASEDGVSGGATVAAVEMRRLIVPSGTDVLTTDRIETITFRGETYIDGPMEILALVSRSDRIELYLRRAS